MTVDESELGERYGALKNLRVGGTRRIPFVQQLTEMECGAACLTMVLGYYGKQVSLDQVRDVMGPGRDGVTALGIVNAADAFGLRGRGVRVDVEDLEYVDRGAILHWRFDHFVVFEGLRKHHVDIVDPALGRRAVPLDEFGKSFTGVALLLEPGETFVQEKRIAPGLWSYTRALLFARPGLLGQILIISTLLQLFALAVPVLTGVLVDRVVPRGDRHLLVVVGIGLLSLVVFQFLATLTRGHLLLALRTRLDVKMTLGFLDHLISLPYSFFQLRSAGDLMMRMNSNAQVREVMTSSALSAFLDGLLVLLYLVILLIASPTLGLVVMGIGALYGLLFLVTWRKKRDLASEGISREARAQSYQVEMLTSVETLKAVGAEQRAAEHWSQLFVDVLNSALVRGRFDATVEAILGVLRFGAPLAILVYGGLQVLAGTMSLGTMLALSALAAGFLTPLATLVQTSMQFQVVASYVERIDDVLKAEPEQNRARTKVAPRLSGRITLDRVSFRYSPIAPLVVRDITLDVQPGAFIGVVGRSGAGKSTLIALLAGLYAPSHGRVLYDGQSMLDFDLRLLRRQLGIVTQNAYLFGSTIRANIALAHPTATLDEVMEAAKLARIHDEIVLMPMGYDTPLIDRGASLSGGQRQRIALARALLSKPAVLILDEATSALDGITERGVQDELAALRCTRIAIAHRLSTVMAADQILVMSDGQIVERGNHGQLVAMGGHYANLVSAQTAHQVGLDDLSLAD